MINSMAMKNLSIPLPPVQSAVDPLCIIFIHFLNIAEIHVLIES